jgi:predicted transcriptional regulator
MDFKQGDFENILLNAVWDMEEADFFDIDVSEVLAKINTGEQIWAYTTVKTVLDRLVKKDVLERIKSNKKFFYKSRISRKEAGINALEKLARQYFKGDVTELLRTAERVYAGAYIYR